MAGLVAELSDAEFDKSVIENGDTFLVDFWAPWCAPCRNVAPIVEELAQEYDGKMKVGKVNIDNHQQVAERYGITSIPTLMIFKGGELKQRITGALPKANLKQEIDRVLG